MPINTYVWYKELWGVGGDIVWLWTGLVWSRDVGDLWPNAFKFHLIRNTKPVSTHWVSLVCVEMIECYSPLILCTLSGIVPHLIDWVHYIHQTSLTHKCLCGSSLLFLCKLSLLSPFTCGLFRYPAFFFFLLFVYSLLFVFAYRSFKGALRTPPIAVKMFVAEWPFQYGN